MIGLCFVKLLSGKDLGDNLAVQGFLVIFEGFLGCFLLFGRVEVDARSILRSNVTTLSRTDRQDVIYNIRRTVMTEQLQKMCHHPVVFYKEMGL